MAAKAEAELREILMNTGVLLPVKSSGKTNKVSVLCRQVPGQEKAWLRGLTNVLTIAEVNGFEVHACRQYVLKDGKLAFGWHVSIERRSAKDLAAALGHVRTALKDVEPDLTTPVAAPPQPSQPTSPKKLLSTSAPNSKELAQRRREYARKTTAPPRPAEPATPLVPPEGDAPPARLELVVNTRDRKSGAPVLEFEMPLPHTYTELNKPNDKGRGAWAGDFRPMVGRK